MSIKVKPQKKIDIIVGNKKIKQALLDKKNQFKLSYSDMVNHSKDAGLVGLSKSMLSLYFSNDIPVSGFPTQKHILFMCFRYGIKVGMEVKSLKITEEELNGKYRELARKFAKETE